MISTKTQVTVAVVFGLSSTFSAAQVPTIAERVQASGGKPLRILVVQHGSPVSIADLTAASDLVVEGKLVRLRSYTSKDAIEVLTDYQIVPSQVFRAQGKDVATTPGQRPPLVLTMVGGEISVNGTPVEVVNPTQRPIKNGGHYLLFAKRSVDGENRYSATEGSAGIFEVIDGQRVKSLVKRTDDDPEVHDVPFTEIVRRIQAATARK